MKIRAATVLQCMELQKSQVPSFLSYCLTNSLFLFFVHPAAINISAHTLFAERCKWSTSICVWSTLRIVLFWKLKLVLVVKVQNSLLRCWRYFKYSAIYPQTIYTRTGAVADRRLRTTGVHHYFRHQLSWRNWQLDAAQHLNLFRDAMQNATSIVGCFNIGQWPPTPGPRINWYRAVK